MQGSKNVISFQIPLCGCEPYFGTLTEDCNIVDTVENEFQKADESKLEVPWMPTDNILASIQNNDESIVLSHATAMVPFENPIAVINL